MKISHALFGIVFILGAAAFPHPAAAYFTGTAGASGATMSAGTLAFTLGSASNPFSASLAAGATTDPVAANISNAGSIGFQYKTDAENIVCDPIFESDLTVTATRDSVQVYSGSLAGFASTTNDSSGSWSFQFALADGSAAAPAATCSFDITFSAWQSGMPTPSAGGFTAEHSLHVSLVVPTPTPQSNPPAAPVVTAVSPNGGMEAGGDTVTITGSGFTGATVVDFGGISATNVTASSTAIDTSITVTSPATTTAGTVDVTVTTPGGTSAIVSADQFTYAP